MKAQTLEQVSPQQRLIITVVVMVSTVMQLLDTTIINVALPHIKGQLSATSAQISWVLTSYVVASSVMMPLTGYFSDRFGVRRLLLLSVGGFTVTSLLCGLSTTLGELVLFRLFQGIFGAALVPVSQMVMIQVYPPEERGRAMALWGMGIMLGPVMGPSLGGWLTERWSWHWTFFINVPIGVVIFLAALAVMPSGITRARRLDWTGFALMAVAICGIQLTLDLGERYDWFSSNAIRIFLLVAMVSGIGYVWHSLTTRHEPLLNIAMFRDRNFTTGVMIITVMTLGFYGASMLMPLMLVSSLGFSSLVTGLLLAPRGLAIVVSSLIAGHLMRSFGERAVVALGIIIVVMGTLPMISYSLETTPAQVVIPGLIQGLGLGLIFVPLTTITYATLAPHMIGEATGVFSLLRSIGGSFGIAILASLFARQSDAAWSQLRGGINLASPVFQDWLLTMGLDPDAPVTWQVVAGQVFQQSQIVAYIDGYKFVTVTFMLLLPLCFLFKSHRAVVDSQSEPATAASS